MDQIEKQVQLPRDARPLRDYARYYAYADTGDVKAIYLVPFDDDLKPGEGCDELLEDFTSKQVPCPDLDIPTMNLKAGQRRWMRDNRHLPAVNDGGCAVVNVSFDWKKGKVKEVRCNGFA